VRIVLLDAGSPETCEPLTCTRPLQKCPVANRPLGVWQYERLETAAGCGDEHADRVLTARGDAWIAADDLTRLSAASGDGSAVLVAPDGSPLAWLTSESAETPPAAADHIPASEDSFLIRYPWDLLRINEMLVGALDEDRIDGEIEQGVTIHGHVIVGTGTRLLAGTYIEGNAVIGADCRIGPNCYIRGNTAIGDGCYIGQAVEVKNSILMAGVSMGHLSYCGDSIIGEQVNFGAGAITANFRHDGLTHRSMVQGVLVDTGRQKFGAIVGDGVHTGIHTAIYPGRKIWPDVWTRPGDIVQKDLHGDFRA